MLKKAFLIISFICFVFHLKAHSGTLKPDSLLYTLQLTDHSLKEQRLTKYINTYFPSVPVDSFVLAKKQMSNLLLKYNMENKEAYELYIESIYHNRLQRTDEAKNDLLKAIDIAAATHDHYLWYMFLTHLAFIQTYDGNPIGAIMSFREAKKEAVILKDAFLQVAVDVNISDIYYRYNLYSQSLDYLGRAQALAVGGHVRERRVANVIYYNKCENYFRMGKLDSLSRYHLKLKNSRDKTYKLHTYINRTGYYIYLINHNYKGAIALINAARADTLYKYDNLDRQNLADAYLSADMPDSAKKIVEALLPDNSLVNHPEIKYHLYDVLGSIAEMQGDHEAATKNYKFASIQSKENNSKLIQVGDIASRIKIDEVSNSYIQQDEMYKRERLLLMFIIVVAMFMIIVIAMFYRNVKQKRHYERLLFVAKKEEISFINSHNIRKHLSNIMGIIDAIKRSDNKPAEYLEMEAPLFYSVEQLDESIKNISDKLSD